MGRSEFVTPGGRYTVVKGDSPILDKNSYFLAVWDRYTLLEQFLFRLWWMPYRFGHKMAPLTTEAVASWEGGRWARGYKLVIRSQPLLPPFLPRPIFHLFLFFFHSFLSWESLLIFGGKSPLLDFFAPKIFFLGSDNLFFRQIDIRGDARKFSVLRATLVFPSKKGRSEKRRFLYIFTICLSSFSPLFSPPLV